MSKKSTGGFGVVYQDVMRNKQLSPEAKAIYAYLSSIAGAEDSCYPSVETMQKELCMSKNRLMKHMGQLIVFGVVEKVRERNGNIYGRNTYKITHEVEVVNDLKRIFEAVENEAVEIRAVENEATNNNKSVENIAESEGTAITEEGTEFSINVEGIMTTDELETRIDEHLDSLLASLDARKEALFTEIDTYDKYYNSDTVSVFYETIIDETEKIGIMLCEYSAQYAKMILDSDMSSEDKYDAIDGINDCIYEDACDEINDQIYEDIMDDMYDYFYEGILDDAQDEVAYDQWYNTCSDEYSQWYDTSSEVYSIYYDTASDIYSFYYDMSGELYSGDYERAAEIYQKFIEKIEKAKGNGVTEDDFSDAIFDTALRDAATIEELEETIEFHVLECISALGKEWEDLSTEIDTYEKYAENVDRVEEFHVRVEEASAEILTMICKYGVSYTEIILAADTSTDEKYDDFEDFKDCIYEDSCELVRDEIYENLLEEVREYYYEGIIYDAKDLVDYGDWSDARSDTYDWWSDARSEVYDNWSDTRSDLYGFWSDVRSELYGDNLDDAKTKTQKFLEDVSE